MVRWSAAASRDLRSIFDYIARDSRHYARQVVDTILATADDIEPFTERGRVVPEIDDESIREVFVYSYRVIYERRHDDVVVIAVIHGRRLLPPLKPDND